MISLLLSPRPCVSKLARQELNIGPGHQVFRTCERLQVWLSAQYMTYATLGLQWPYLLVHKRHQECTVQATV